MAAEEAVIKEEPEPHEEYVLEDDIKIEETCVHSSNEDSVLLTNVPVLTCSLCNCAFESKAEIKPEHKLDVVKCYKCILESRLGKHEEHCVPVIAPRSVIVKRIFLVCSMCRCVFERTANIKPHSKVDMKRCSKCILHTRLSQIFSNTSRRKTKSPREKSSRQSQSEIVDLDSDSRDSEPKSFSVTKVMYVCAICNTHFERTNSTGVKQPSDWYKCNRCILHTRLNTVFSCTKPRNRKT